MQQSLRITQFDPVVNISIETMPYIHPTFGPGFRPVELGLCQSSEMAGNLYSREVLRRGNCEECVCVPGNVQEWDTTRES